MRQQHAWIGWLLAGLLALGIGTFTQTKSKPSRFGSSRQLYETTKPLVAENGSRYDEISRRTGRPKTMFIRGYYRSDGTYVRGHYRSRPR